MNQQNKLKLLQTIFWDYNTNLLPLENIISRELDKIDNYTLKFIINRIFERLNWYEILDLLGLELIKSILKDKTILNLHNTELKDKYERLRRILFNEPLPFTGWDPQYREKVKFTVLSNRWYSTK
ncbi:MAG: hypothetical protein NZM09_09610 [Ignavibacterium sp.]|nr:hypothetical protein [Ignavibacterium sp.]MDW8375933.1 hypothetical protein [Ignavibacteriales bacterium]